MLDVAGRAGRRENLIRMVNGPIVASEAGAIVRFCAEKSSAHHMACAAILRENGVRGREWSGAVEFAVVSDSISCKPQQRRNGH